jgi:hypothetical protein
MIPFTLVAAAAINAFTWKMRSNSLPTSFDWRGEMALIFIGLMICSGWFLVGRTSGAHGLPSLRLQGKHQHDSGCILGNPETRIGSSVSSECAVVHPQ